MTDLLVILLVRSPYDATSTSLRCVEPTTLGLRLIAFALVNASAWIFIIPATLIFNRYSESWIWESIPKEGKKRLRKIWARNAREAQMLLQTHASQQGDGGKASEE